jgi:hypothetical protein
VLNASKKPTLTCLGTHASLKKFKTKTKVSNPLQFIYKSKVTLVVTQLDRARYTYVSIIFYSMEGICSSINCLQLGNQILLSLHLTRLWRHDESTLNKDS